MFYRLILTILLLVAGFIAYIARKLLGLDSSRQSFDGEQQSLLQMSSKSDQPKTVIIDRTATTIVTKAFVICIHPMHGFLILFAFKASKGKHGQLPGGGVDSGETADIAAAREVFEETGMRIQPARLAYHCDIDGKRFYVLILSDEDSVSAPSVNWSCSGENFALQLSHEHIDFLFIADQAEACAAIRPHSGGSCAKALKRLDLSKYTPR